MSREGLPAQVFRDRITYLHWLFEARKRYGLELLNMS